MNTTETPTTNDELDADSHLRSILKGITWRVVATTTIIIIVYFTTGDISGALTIGAFEFVIKFLLYYFHERAWAKVPRGGIRRLKDRILGK